MTHQEAINLIEKVNASAGGIWADLGAGSGRFTLALAELTGESGTVYAIDQKPNIPSPPISSASIIPQKADFTKELTLTPLDGILMANSLHYVKDQESFLNNLLTYLKPNGIFLLVEYNMSRGNPWVPYPIGLLSSEIANLQSGLFPSLFAIFIEKSRIQSDDLRSEIWKWNDLRGKNDQTCLDAKVFILMKFHSIS